MMHYSKAVSSLQMAIDEGRVDGSEDSTLAAVVFLLLFEVFPHLRKRNIAALTR